MSINYWPCLFIDGQKVVWWSKNGLFPKKLSMYELGSHIGTYNCVGASMLLVSEKAFYVWLISIQILASFRWNVTRSTHTHTQIDNGQASHMFNVHRHVFFLAVQLMNLPTKTSFWKYYTQSPVFGNTVTLKVELVDCYQCAMSILDKIWQDFTGIS